MSKILYSKLEPTLTINSNGGYCEYSYEEVNEADCGEEWGGNLIDYMNNELKGVNISNIDIEDSRKYTIHNNPNGSLVFCSGGTPLELYWLEG